MFLDGHLAPKMLLALFDSIRQRCRSDNHAFEEVAAFLENEGSRPGAQFRVQSHAAAVQAVRRAVKARAKSDDSARKALAEMKQAHAGQPEPVAKLGGLFGLSASALGGYRGDGAE